MKSRRIGITWAEALRQVLVASSADGCSCYYVSTSQVLGREYIETAADWARALELQRPGRVLARTGKAIQADRIRFASGHVLDAVTSNPRALRGRGGDVVVDEAAHHQDLEAMLKAAFAVKTWSAFGITLISTHNGAESPFAELTREVELGRRRGILHACDLETAVADGLYRRICALSRIQWSPAQEREWVDDKLTEPGADEEYRCIPARSGSVYFRRDLLERQAYADGAVLHWRPGDDYLHRPDRESTTRSWCREHLDPILRRLPDRLPVSIGGDFARSGDGDLSCLALLVERQDLSRAVPLVIELRGVPYDDQWIVLRYLIDFLGDRLGRVVVDGAGNGGWLAEQAVAYLGPGIAEGVSMTSEWKVREFGRTRLGLEERRLWIPADLDIRGDFGLIRLKKGAPEVPDLRTRSTRDGGKRHADACVAIVAAVAATSDPPDPPDVSLADDDDAIDPWPRGGRGGF